MPGGPAPPVEAMPRMEMLLVPELSILTPGVKCTMSWKSLMPRRSMASCVSAVTLIGTLLRLSSWRVAVTVISCNGPLASAAAVVSAADAGAAYKAAGAPPIAAPRRGSLPSSRQDIRNCDMRASPAYFERMPRDDCVHIATYRLNG